MISLSCYISDSDCINLWKAKYKPMRQYYLFFRANTYNNLQKVQRIRRELKFNDFQAGLNKTEKYTFLDYEEKDSGKL